MMNSQIPEMHYKKQCPTSYAQIFEVKSCQDMLNLGNPAP